jgi:hypothetical protein
MTHNHPLWSLPGGKIELLGGPLLTGLHNLSCTDKIP